MDSNMDKHYNINTIVIVKSQGSIINKQWQEYQLLNAME